MVKKKIVLNYLSMKTLKMKKKNYVIYICINYFLK